MAKTGDMQAGLETFNETFNQQPCSPESCHSVTLAKVLLFGKAAPFFAKKGHCSNLIFGAVNTLAFWTPKSGPSQYTKLTWVRRHLANVCDGTHPNPNS